MLPRALLTALCLTVVCLTLEGTAFAQAAPEPSREARTEASERFQRGVTLFQENAFRAALVEFERAYEIAPDYRLLYNIGQVQLQLSDYLSATHSYERYLAEGGADVSEARREEVEKALKILNERVGRVAIQCNTDGADIFVDDQQVGVTPLSSPVVVNVGRHRVYARGADGAVATQTIDVAGGDSLTVKLKLKVASAAEPTVVAETRPMSKLRKIAITSWVVGGVSLVAATLTGFAAQGKIDDRESELKKELPDQDKLRELGDSASRLALTTDFLGGLAIVGVASGVVLWVMDSRLQAAERDQAQARGLSFQVGLGTVSAKGSF